MLLWPCLILSLSLMFSEKNKDIDSLKASNMKRQSIQVIKYNAAAHIVEPFSVYSKRKETDKVKSDLVRTLSLCTLIPLLFLCH